MKLGGIVLCALVVSIVAVLPAQVKGKKAPKKAPKAKRVSYTGDVVPVFKKFCLPCHTEDQMNPSGLYFDSYENMMKGGKHGGPIIPGKADSSLVVQKLSPKPPFGDQMPLKPKVPFTEEDLKIIRNWINQGAKKN